MGGRPQPPKIDDRPQRTALTIDEKRLAKESSRLASSRRGGRSFRVDRPEIAVGRPVMVPKNVQGTRVA